MDIFNVSYIRTCLLLISFLSTSQSFAQQKQPDQTLQEISVYSTLQPQSTFDVPGIVSVIVPDSSPKTSIAEDFEDILKYTPGVEATGGPRSKGQNTSIRGLGSYSVVTLIDGRRQNYEAFHNSRVFLDPALIKSVEIFQSGSSAVYGSGAVGGLIAFDTKDAADILAPGQNAGASISAGSRSGNTGYSSSFLTGARTQNWDILANLSFRKSGDIQQGGSEYLPSKDQVLSSLLKAGYTFNNFHTLKVQSQIYDSDGSDAVSASKHLSHSNSMVNKIIEDRQFSLKYIFDNPSNQYFKPKLHAYHNYTDVKETAVSGRSIGRKQSRLLKTFGFTLNNQSAFSYGFGNRDLIIDIGAELYQDQQTGTRSVVAAAAKTPAKTTAEDTVRPGVPNATSLHRAVYTQVIANFHSPIGKFQGITALRLGQHTSSPEKETAEVKKQSATNFSPKFSLSFKPIEPLIFFGSVSQAFRSPNLTEMYASGLHYPGSTRPGGSYPDNYHIPNPDLKTEEVISYEFGAGLQLEKVFTSEDHFKIKGSFFRSTGNNFITQTSDHAGGTTQFVNINKAKLSGWEAGMEYKIFFLTAKLGASSVTARDATTDIVTFLSNNVPLTVLASLDAQLNAFSHISWNTRYAEKHIRVEKGNKPSDGYVVHDVYYRLELPRKDKKFFTLDAGLSNIFDKKYQKNYAYPFEEGMSLLFKASLQF